MTMKWTGPEAVNKKHRALVTIIILVLLFTVFSILYARLAASSPEPVVYVVRKGDTLWNICKSYYGDNQDVRKMVWQVRELNGITDPGELQPGQQIYLPVVD